MVACYSAVQMQMQMQMQPAAACAVIPGRSRPSHARIIMYVCMYVYALCTAM